MNIIYTSNAPEPVWPYSQAIQVWNMLYCSGQIWIDPATGEIWKNIEEQFLQITKNIDAVLTEAGTNKHHVVKSTIFVIAMDQYGLVNTLYAEYFADHAPARSCVEVSRLPKDVLVEMEVIVSLEE